MVTCALCGSEEIEKPKEIVVFIPKIELASGEVIRTEKVIRVLFGSYCFSKYKNACRVKANTIRNLELNNVPEKYRGVY